MRIHGTDSGRLSTTLEDEDVQTPSQPSTLSTMGRVRGIMAERDEIVARLNEYKVRNENLERKVAELDVISKALPGSVKQL